MFICNECGHIFDEPGTWNEYHPYGEGYVAESWSGCPHCHEGYSEAVECECCGEYFAKEEMHNGMCEECFDNARKNIVKAISNLFTKREFDSFPDDMFDDIWQLLEQSYEKEESK